MKLTPADVAPETQLVVVERIAEFIEGAKKILGEASCLDVLEGSPSHSLRELQHAFDRCERESAHSS